MGRVASQAAAHCGRMERLAASLPAPPGRLGGRHQGRDPRGDGSARSRAFRDVPIGHVINLASAPTAPATASRVSWCFPPIDHAKPTAGKPSRGVTYIRMGSVRHSGTPSATFALAPTFPVKQTRQKSHRCRQQNSRDACCEFGEISSCPRYPKSASIISIKFSYTIDHAVLCRGRSHRILCGFA